MDEYIQELCTILDDLETSYHVVNEIDLIHTLLKRLGTWHNSSFTSVNLQLENLTFEDRTTFDKVGCQKFLFML